MDFESPDVEKDFPGLYASEAIRKCNESDFSDENHDKAFKKELIIGKRKEKKDSKKDRGYAALEGESSQEEDADIRSPCKSKKTKSFKFSTKKAEKREKSKEKDTEKKDKEKKDKDKIKNKEKKKVKCSEETGEFIENYDIFGVNLNTAVERNGCLDGVPIPLVVRNCIDCIHSFGLCMDGLYKTLGIKSKVQLLRKMYNNREHVSLGECDVPAATCLLKMFLKELPEPILTLDLLRKFEEAGAIMEVDSREQELQNLIMQLPNHNRVLLGWLITHFDTVTMHEKHNKLNAQSIAMTFSPVLQMSHRLLTAFQCHCKPLFSDILIERYIPPLCPGSSFPEKPEEIALELKKQEFLLNQIHKEMSKGFVSKKKEEQLWEVQRIVTQLKRKLRSLQKFQESNTSHRSLEDFRLNSENNVEPKAQLGEKNEPQTKQNCQKENSEETLNEGAIIVAENKSAGTLSEDSNETDNSPYKSSPEKPPMTNATTKSANDRMTVIESGTLKSQLEYEELLKFQTSLKNRIEQEKGLILELIAKIETYSNKTPPPNSPETDVPIEKLEKDNQMLLNKMRDLTLRIFEERIACIKLKVCVDFLTIPKKES